MGLGTPVASAAKLQHRAAALGLSEGDLQSIIVGLFSDEEAGAPSWVSNRMQLATTRDELCAALAETATRYGKGNVELLAVWRKHTGDTTAELADLTRRDPRVVGGGAAAAFGLAAGVVAFYATRPPTLPPLELQLDGLQAAAVAPEAVALLRGDLPKDIDLHVVNSAEPLTEARAREVCQAGLDRPRGQSIAVDTEARPWGTLLRCTPQTRKAGRLTPGTPEAVAIVRPLETPTPTTARLPLRCTVPALPRDQWRTEEAPTVTWQWRSLGAETWEAERPEQHVDGGLSSTAPAGPGHWECRAARVDALGTSAEDARPTAELVRPLMVLVDTSPRILPHPGPRACPEAALTAALPSQCTGPAQASGGFEARLSRCAQGLSELVPMAFESRAEHADVTLRFAVLAKPQTSGNWYTAMAQGVVVERAGGTESCFVGWNTQPEVKASAIGKEGGRPLLSPRQERETSKRITTDLQNEQLAAVALRAIGPLRRAPQDR